MIEDRDKELCVSVWVPYQKIQESTRETKRWHWPKIHFGGFYRHSREISVAVGGENMFQITFGRWTNMGKVYGVGLMLFGRMMELEFRYKNYNKYDPRDSY